MAILITTNVTLYRECSHPWRVLQCNEHEIRKQVDIQNDVIRNPHKLRPEGEWTGGEIMRQWVIFYLIFNTSQTYLTVGFWEHARAQSQKRFCETFPEFMESMMQEANDRSEGPAKLYQRKTIELMPCFSLN